VARRPVTERSAVERASDSDRLWFERHPGSRVRLRPMIAGEFDVSGIPADLPADGWVRVRQLAPGVRVREPLL
jgi:hypothetical protein